MIISPVPGQSLEHIGVLAARLHYFIGLRDSAGHITSVMPHPASYMFPNLLNPKLLKFYRSRQAREGIGCIPSVGPLKSRYFFSPAKRAF